jgi:hypothetical protein
VIGKLPLVTEKPVGVVGTGGVVPLAPMQKWMMRMSPSAIPLGAVNTVLVRVAKFWMLELRKAEPINFR